MSLLKLTTYDGKPYSSGFSFAETKQFYGLNFLNFKEEKSKPLGKVDKILIHARLDFVRGDNFQVVYNTEDGGISPAKLLDPASYIMDGAEETVRFVNFSTVNFVYAGMTEIETTGGEIHPIESTSYQMAMAEGSILGQQVFEVLKSDLMHEESDSIHLYPLGGFYDPGKSIKKISPVYFYVLQHGVDTLLNLVTSDRINEVGGNYSPEGFMHDGQHYRFQAEKDQSFHQSLENFIQSGGVKFHIGQTYVAPRLSGSSAAAASASASASSSAPTRRIEIESCEIYGQKADKVILGFKLG